MGLIKKDGYIVKGVKLQPAYAKIIWLEATTSPNGENNLNATFGISTVRKNLDNGEILSSQNFSCPYDRSQDNLFEQAYEKAKETIFLDWEDDIIDPESIN